MAFVREKGALQLQPHIYTNKDTKDEIATNLARKGYVFVFTYCQVFTVYYTTVASTQAVPKNSYRIHVVCIVHTINYFKPFTPFPHLTSSECVSNLGNYRFIGVGGGRRCEHKHKVENKGIPGIFIIINTPGTPHNAVS